MVSLNAEIPAPRFEGLVVIVGAYGSGKTEVAINLAAVSKKAGSKVWIADLDLVNPYFRTREAKAALSRMGIDVVLPPEAYLKADLPILSPMVAGVIRRPDGLVILDVGGNDAGATVLAALADAFHAARAKRRPLHVLWVVNPFRPFTETLSGCQKMRFAIEQASKQDVTGIIGNANLMEETTIQDICRGYDFVRRLSEKNRLPLEMITIPRPLLKHIDKRDFSCPVLSIERQLVFPWKTTAEYSFGGASGSLFENEKQSCTQEGRLIPKTKGATTNGISTPN